MIIFGGTNVYPAEIEAVLIDMPGIQDCAVFGIPDDEFGEVVATAVEPCVAATVDEADVLDFLRPRLATYKMPRHVEILERLPREASGKILKRKLREPHWQATGRTI
jgi:long-chain acyl-CoA synthetase